MVAVYIPPYVEVTSAWELANILSKIIQIYKNLKKKQLIEHKIETKLCNGGSIHCIYQIIHDSRVTQCLSAACDRDFDD